MTQKINCFIYWEIVIKMNKKTVEEFIYFLFPLFLLSSSRNSSRNMSKVALIPKGVSQSWKSLSELERSSLEEEEEDLALDDEEDNEEAQVGQNNKFRKFIAKRRRKKKNKKGVTFRETVKRVQVGKKIGMEIMVSFEIENLFIATII